MLIKKRQKAQSNHHIWTSQNSGTNALSLKKKKKNEWVHNIILLAYDVNTNKMVKEHACLTKNREFPSSAIYAVFYQLTKDNDHTDLQIKLYNVNLNLYIYYIYFNWCKTNTACITEQTTNVRYDYNIFHILAPLRRPSWELSKAAFVMNLKAEVIAPDAAKPAKNDCMFTRKTCKSYAWQIT